MTNPTEVRYVNPYWIGEAKATPNRRQDFLAAYRQTGEVRAAATSIGLSARAIYKWRERHPDFRQEMDAAKDELRALTGEVSTHK